MPYTITIATQTQEPVCVYSDQPTIIALFKRLALANVTIYEVCGLPQKTTRLQTIGRIIYTVLYRRYVLLFQLQKMNPSSVYFFHDSFGTMELWLISKLSKQASVMYCPVLRHPLQCDSMRDVKRPASFYYEKIFWGLSRYPIDYGKIRWFVADSFFDSYAIQEKKIQISIPQYVTAKIKRQYAFSHAVVVLVENIFANPSVEQETYFRLIQDMIDTIGAEHIVLKNHPRFPFDVRQYLRGDYEVLSSDVPITLMLQDCSVVIGNWTSVLFEAEPYEVCAISLLDILRPYYKSELYQGHFRYLQDNDVHNRILYPHTMDELCALVKQHI